MRKVEICRKITSLGNKDQKTLVYFIIVDTLSNESREIEIENYGVGVSIEESGEEAEVREITTSQFMIGGLADLLASNLVTPFTLEEIVIDWLG